MLDYLKLDLQLFAEGADGGDGAGEAGAQDSGEDSIPAGIPERAQKAYREALKKSAPKPKEEPTPQKTEDNAHISYADLIKSDEYKEEHKAYMDKAIGDRLKRYKGIEAENQKMLQALSVVGNKYNLDPSSENFLADLTGKIDGDNSYYEDYAMEHNISTEDAKEILTLRQQAKVNEQQREQARIQQAQQEEYQRLLQSAENTKQVYPDFNLDIEMQNELFRNLCAITHGDTLAAYRTIHHDELLRAQGLAASQRAHVQVAQTVAANKARPIENGLSSQASVVTNIDWSKASHDDIRKYAAEQRRKMNK